MGITLQQYRISIGTYSKSGLPKLGIKNRRTLDKLNIRMNRNQKRLLFQLFVWTLTYLFLNASLFTTATDEPRHCMGASHMKVETQVCLKTFPQKLQEYLISPQYLTWASSSSLSINKLCQILFGNRRNLGYKFFSWNCDRAYLSKKQNRRRETDCNEMQTAFYWDI